VVDREHLLIADEPQAFADAVLAVTSDAALAQRLGRQGRQLAEQKYTWGAVVSRLEAFYDRLLADANAGDRIAR
jgi:glycosyltransferase involved in cell wall biosynthesis